MPAQITVLLALTANLFDPVPLEKMAEAGHAVREAASSIPAEISARFETAAKLSDEDRRAIVEIARLALASFQPKPEPEAETKGDSKDKAETSSNEEVKPKPNPQVKAESKPQEAKPAEAGRKEKA